MELRYGAITKYYVDSKIQFISRWRFSNPRVSDSSIAACHSFLLFSPAHTRIIGGILFEKQKHILSKTEESRQKV